MAFARLEGSPLLKMPAADEHAIHAEMRHQGCIGRGGDAARCRSRRGQTTQCGDFLDRRAVGSLNFFCEGEEFIFMREVSLQISP